MAATFLIGVFAALTIWPRFGETQDSLPSWLTVIVAYGLLFGITLERAWWAGLTLTAVLGSAPSARRSYDLVLLAIPLCGVGLVTTYVTWLPLSFAAPGLTQFWLLEGGVELYDVGPPFPLVGNLVAFVAAVMIGPLVEEWFFRGLLLRRWSHKWGPAPGVVGSSLVFAVLHPDVVGAFLFGVVACGMYASSGSLWPPLIVHAGHNALAWAVDALDEYAGNPLAMESIADLRAAVWMPAVGMAMLLPWMGQARRSWTPITAWRFLERPANGERQHVAAVSSDAT